MKKLWHALDTAVLFEALGTGEGGLGASLAAERLASEGPNTLPTAKPDSLVLLFLRQFQSPLIYILLIACVAVYSIGEIADSGIILAVLLFNAVIGTVQEGRAQNTLLALTRFVATTATVVRGGTELSIPDSEVVPGDLLIVREGEKIPADARIIEAQAFKVSEATLTGESEPVEKTSEVLAATELPVATQHNMVFKGTMAVTGSARAVVVATGLATVIGALAKEVAAIDTEIPLAARIRQLSRVVVGVVLLVGAALFLLGLFRGESLGVIFATTVSFIVSIVPEGLPVVITLVLTTGVWRMAKRNVLVKKLQAVEALGQARVIAVDKTGTITKNELAITAVYSGDKTFTVSGNGYEPTGAVSLERSVVSAANHLELLFMGKLAALSASARVFFSEKDAAWQVVGDPTEAAIRVFGEKLGFKQDELFEELPRTAHMPFDYEQKYHAGVFGKHGHAFLVVSGAPEAVLAKSTHVRGASASRPLTAADRLAIEEKITDLSSRGLRVIALAVEQKFSGALTPSTVKGLSFAGLLGMQDVLRPEVRTAVERAHDAGIRVVMITGDHTLTATAIAKEAGIWLPGNETLTGAAIDELSDTALAARVDSTAVFARVTPEHKLRIVRAYQARGEVIAMTGDGVNDAPSLVAADLGIAMGRTGTEVAKEAADLILLDDNFESILAAVEEGRNIYRTIKKVILYLFSTGLGEALTILGALVVGYPLPLLAVQIIWLNFVTDGFLDVALAMEPKDEELLHSGKAARKQSLIDLPMARRMLFMALPMMLGTLYLFQAYTGDGMEKAWTMALTVLAVFQWGNAWNCRSEAQSVFSSSPFTNIYLVMATGVVVALQLLAVYVPFFQKLLHTVPLSLFEWGIILLVASSVVVLEEVRKFFLRRRLRAA